MALAVADRVQETSSTAGTGTLSLAGPVAGYQSFVSGVGSGNTTYYTIYDQTAQVWEVGYGTVTAGSPNTLSRTTILANSSGTTSPLNLAGNSVSVWCDYPAEKSVYKDASGAVAGLTLTNPTINGFTGDTSVVNIGSGQFYKDTSGNVGIGTSSPGYKLDVFKGTTNGAIAEFTGNNASRGLKISTAQTTFADDTVVLDAQMASNGVLQLATGGVTRATLDSSGNLGIGTSSPGAKLEVNGNVILGQEVYRNSATSLLRLAGGSASATGAGISLFGESHATLPNTLSFFNSGSERMRIDSSGNLGLGVTPSANCGGRSLNIGNAGTGAFAAVSLGGAGGDYGGVGYNLGWQTTTGQYKYLLTDTSSWIQFANGGFKFFTAPSGTAGNAISFTQAMTLDASGNLGIGTSSPSAPLHVYANTSKDIINLNYSVLGKVAGVYIDSTNVYYGGGTNNYTNAFSVAHQSNYASIYTNGSERARIDSSGNLGLGVTPSAWGTNYKASEVKTSAVYDYIGTSGGLVFNAYYNGTNWIYKGSGGNAWATRYEQSAGHTWYTAPSGTAGNAISFTQAMTLDASGNLNIANLTASRAVVTDGSKNLASSATTSTELGYVSGVTSAIQTQLNAKAPSTTATSSQLLAGNGSGGFTNITVGTGLRISGTTLYGSYSANYLVVAGGGGGGVRIGGGGGAGGLVSGTILLSASATYTITVGAGATAVTGSPGAAGNVGNNSSIAGTITAIAGGGGGSYAYGNATSGGSGGGGGGLTSAGASGTSGQGYAGGTASSNNGGGGGGAGAVGSSPGAGGIGVASSITGTSVYYAGGGGGANNTGGATFPGGNGGGGTGQSGTTTGGSGTANTGGGGGGARNITDSAGVVGGAGGSGVVILSIPTSAYSGTTTGSPTVTTSGSNTILKFTSSGSYTA